MKAWRYAEWVAVGIGAAMAIACWIVLLPALVWHSVVSEHRRKGRLAAGLVCALLAGVATACCGCASAYMTSRHDQEAAQAENLRGYMDCVRQYSRIRNTFIYDIIDDPNPVDPMRFGLYRANLTIKPAGAELRRALTEVP